MEFVVDCSVFFKLVLNSANCDQIDLYDQSDLDLYFLYTERNNESN